MALPLIDRTDNRPEPSLSLLILSLSKDEGGDLKYRSVRGACAQRIRMATKHNRSIQIVMPTFAGMTKGPLNAEVALPHRGDGRAGGKAGGDARELGDVLFLLQPVAPETAAPAGEHRRIDVENREARRQQPRPGRKPLDDQQTLAQALLRLDAQRLG